MTSSKARKPEPEGNWGKAPPSAAAWQARQRAMHRPDVIPTLPLTSREISVITLYAGGSAPNEISFALGLSVETVLAYLERAQLKFVADGRIVADRSQLRAYLIDDGYLET